MSHEVTTSVQHAPKSNDRPSKYSLKFRSFFETKLLAGSVNLIRRFRPALGTRVVQLSKNWIIKYDTFGVSSEVDALEFIAKETTVPVPHVIRTYHCLDGRCYMLMKRCPGVPACILIDGMSSEEREDIFRQLRGYVDQLRSLQPRKAGAIGSTKYGILQDFRLASDPCGPFESVKAFHKGISGGFEYPIGHDEFDKMRTEQESREYSIKFTHGDLSLRHVFVHKGKITGIIDWETAGWYPDYWEYINAWDSCWASPSHREYIPSFLDPFPRELETEVTRRRLCGII